MVIMYPGFGELDLDDNSPIHTAKKRFGRIAFAQSYLYGWGDNQGTIMISRRAVNELIEKYWFF